MASLLNVLQDYTAGRQYVVRTLSKRYKRHHDFRKSSCKPLMTVRIQLEITDGFICRDSRYAAHSLNARPQAKFPTCLRVLS